MGVDVDRDLDRFLDRLNQLVGVVRGQEGRHILEADRLGANRLDLFGVVDIVLGGEGLAEGEGDRDLGVAAFLVGRFDGGLEVADVVERVEDADDVDAVGNRLLDKVLDDVVGVRTVAQHILAAEEHLQLGVGHLFADHPQALPGVFVQETDAGVEGRAAPDFSGIITDLIHLAQDRQHVRQRHTGRQQALVGIAKDGFGNLNRFFGHLNVSSLLYLNS